METGIIPDNDIVATSSKSGHEAGKSRLNGPSCWMPVNNRKTETITIKFKHWVRIIAIATQGSPNDGCWVISYFIKYGVRNVSGSLLKVKVNYYLHLKRVFFPLKCDILIYTLIPPYFCLTIVHSKRSLFSPCCFHRSTRQTLTRKQ